MSNDRKSWDAYFIDISEMVATRATCDRKHVGAVIVMQNRIVATGYNGSVPGASHCDEVGHDMVNDHCVRTIHAEANAIAQAAKFGIDVDGAVLYTNTFPCWICFKLIASAGIARVVYDAEYRKDDRVIAAAGDARHRARSLQTLKENVARYRAMK